MAMIDEVIKDLAAEHFGSRMPRNLYVYLLDHYSAETGGNVWTHDMLYRSIDSDMAAYKDGKLDTTVRTPVKKLQDDNDELLGYVQYFFGECIRLEDEIEYMYDFIRWMHLEEQYDMFRKKAHKCQSEDEPFPHYTM